MVCTAFFCFDYWGIINYLITTLVVAVAVLTT